MKNKFDYLGISVILMLFICSILGILSMDFSNSFDIVNQYGDTVTIYGSGIYAGDTYFKAPISIGTDFAILFIVIPLFIISYINKSKSDTIVNKLRLLSLYGVALYYAASIALGVKYNILHLIYIALFGSTLFGIFKIMREINLDNIDFPFEKGLKIFLSISGFALIVAWLPDIVPTLFNGRPITLIGVYTTEITYVLDMGIIAPLCFICLSMLKKVIVLESLF